MRRVGSVLGAEASKAAPIYIHPAKIQSLIPFLVCGPSNFESGF
jgi:hypothetical protein